MIISAQGLKQLLQSNVAELSFIRRHEKYGWPAGRRMLCTLDRNLLLSLPGRMTLNFKVPSHPPAYPAEAYNLVCVFDLFWQNWRMIPTETTNIVTVIPSHTKKQQDEFWKYFSASLQYMSAQDKEKFMKT